MSMSAATVLLLATALAAGVLCGLADAAVVKHTFRVGNLTLNRLCNDKVIIAVNDQYPGPTIDVIEGDTVVVHVINESPYDITIHWHGVIQMLNNWEDGPSMITQCPIQPGNNMTYQFNVTEQEGTLWWHAHAHLLRATVHGALIIRPKKSAKPYPFTSPDGEATIILGDWYDEDLMVFEEKIRRSNFLTEPKAFTINGKPGDLYNCSCEVEDTYVMKVEVGKTYLLRIINAALNNEFFYKIASHNFIIVAVDACYTNPYHTDTIVIGPGQTVDALLVADASPAYYYMAATPHIAKTPIPSGEENTTTRGVIQYASILPLKQPEMPMMPIMDDHVVAHRFFVRLTGLVSPRQRSSVPLDVDERMFITLGLGSFCKNREAWCDSERLLITYMNNISFVLPKKMSLLDAYYNEVQGIYTTDFPDKPPLFYNFTDISLKYNTSAPDLDYLNKTIEFTSKDTKVKKLKYNTTVEVVLQGVSVITASSHYMHIHGHNFFIVAQGYGNYNQEDARKSYNLINPPMRNTVTTPLEGWVVIRFVANNPGVWLFHCHMDLHFPLGMAMAFIVENGPTSDTILPGPPVDLPKCLTDPQMILMSKSDETY